MLKIYEYKDDNIVNDLKELFELSNMKYPVEVIVTEDQITIVSKEKDILSS